MVCSVFDSSVLKVLTIFVCNHARSSARHCSLSAPEANAYENQSGGVIEMLDKLLDKFIEERTQLREDKHAYNMVKQDLEASIEQAQDRDEKSEFKAETIQAKANATGDLQDTTNMQCETDRLRGESMRARLEDHRYLGQLLQRLCPGSERLQLRGGGDRALEQS